MNIYQKLAFGVTVVLVLAWLAKDDLVMLIILAAVVALLTLPTTWSLIFSVFQMFGILLRGVGHGVGYVGDMIADWSEERRRSLTPRSKTSSTVPDWGSEELRVPTATASTVEPSAELDVPHFMKDDAKRDNAGLEIFEPADN